MMELKDFISKTLVEIIRGVEDAQKEIGDGSAKISPAVHTAFTNTQTGGTNYGLGWAKGGIGVVTGIFALGSQGASDRANTAATKIQFGVPIKLPTT